MSIDSRDTCRSLVIKGHGLGGERAWEVSGGSHLLQDLQRQSDDCKGHAGRDVDRNATLDPPRHRGGARQGWVFLRAQAATKHTKSLASAAKLGDAHVQIETLHQYIGKG